MVEPPPTLPKSGMTTEELKKQFPSSSPPGPGRGKTSMKPRFPGKFHKRILNLERFITFDLAGMAFAAPLAAVREIVPMVALSRPPGLPRFVEGMLNLGGEMVPVLRLAELLGIGGQAMGVDSTLIVVGRGSGSSALPVDEVHDVTRAGKGEIELLPLDDRQAFNNCVTGELRIGESAFHLLAPDRVLLEEETRRLAEFEAIERRRIESLDAEAEADAECKPETELTAEETPAS